MIFNEEGARLASYVRVISYGSNNVIIVMPPTTIIPLCHCEGRAEPESSHYIPIAPGHILHMREASAADRTERDGISAIPVSR